MNKNIKNQIAKAFEAPIPNNKSQFIRSLPRHCISTKSFVLRQIPFIKKKVWILSLFILLPTLLGVCFSSKNIIWIVSSFIPFLALLLITESTKSAIYGMNELEMSSRFSLKSVVLARLIVLGIFNFILFVILIIICYGISKISLLQISIYLFVPYLLTTTISLYIMRHFQSKETIYWCMAVAIIVSGMNTIIHYMADFLFNANYLILWTILTLPLLASTIHETYKIFKKHEGIIWNFTLTD